MRAVSNLRHHLHRFAWIAALAIFGVVFAPTISHGLARLQNQDSWWTQICTPQGMKTVAALAGETSAAPEEGATGPVNPFDHCPLCGLAAAAPTLPPPNVTLWLPLTGATVVPRLFLRAPRPLFAWASAQPRAPPSGA
jgi:hypothetical protein